MQTRPRNAQEAIAQANRHERAKQLLTEGYTFTHDTLTGMVAVCKPGELHAAYWIGEHIDGTNGCDCPDARRGNHCKHVMAWEMIKAEAQQVLRLEEDAAMVALFEEDYKRIADAECAAGVDYLL